VLSFACLGFSFFGFWVFAFCDFLGFELLDFVGFDFLFALSSVFVDLQRFWSLFMGFTRKRIGFGSKLARNYHLGH